MFVPLSYLGNYLWEIKSILYNIIDLRDEEHIINSFATLRDVCVCLLLLHQRGVLPWFVVHVGLDPALDVGCVQHGDVGVDRVIVVAQLQRCRSSVDGGGRHLLLLLIAWQRWRIRFFANFTLHVVLCPFGH